MKRKTEKYQKMATSEKGPARIESKLSRGGKNYSRKGGKLFGRESIFRGDHLCQRGKGARKTGKGDL